MNITPVAAKCNRCGFPVDDKTADLYADFRGRPNQHPLIYMLCKNAIECQKRLAKPEPPKEIPHCRTHLEFRSDCQECVNERAFA